MLVGTEWIVDAEGCDAGALKDPEKLQMILQQVIYDLQLHVLLTPMIHKFPEPGGVTGLIMLTESHLACHTYPEFNAATFNLYCCRLRPEWPWEAQLSKSLGATRVTVRKVQRGAGAGRLE